jgi:hypothetical protein
MLSCLGFIYDLTTMDSQAKLLGGLEGSAKRNHIFSVQAWMAWVVLTTTFGMSSVNLRLMREYITMHNDSHNCVVYFVSHLVKSLL